ncbi:hypothetical protein ACFQY4_19250 [Catellatospora bangladeshensis]|uniref:DUF4386 family protein n=1 Tax=Catellatospora bangladeshensis TaxID=310355 RepID=A0A8J3NLZ7_9ACTN|nr:hypothetical protein [Catellatospora bangladeshensis]GIF84611.1 hypothetical protein Cba03nite_59600 [Catellatospora bangladeshensis]
MSHEMRWGGIAGIAAVALAVLGRLLLGSAPPLGSSGPVIAEYLSGHRTAIVTAMLLYAAAVVAAVWFGITLAALLRRAGESGVVPMLVAGGFILAGAVGLFIVVVFAGMTYAMATHPPLLALAAGPYTALTVAGLLAGVASALPLGAAAIGIARTHALPIWLAWLAGVLAAVRVLAALGVATGVVAPSLVAVQAVIGILAAAWLLATSWLLVREHLPTTSAVHTRHA